MPGPAEFPDPELVLRCAAGDAQAWSAFVRRFDPFLKRCLSSVAAKRGIPASEADLDDLVSGVWEDLLRNDKRALRVWRPETSLDRWLIGIAMDRLLTLARSRSRETRRVGEYRDERLFEKLPPDLPERTAQRKEEASSYVFALPPGERIGAAEGEYTADRGVGRNLELSDGTRLRLEPGARIRLQPPGSGERVHMRVESGAVETDVAPAPGFFRISSEAGEIRVLGTRFWAHAFTVATEPGLCVEVYSGKVRLQGVSGAGGLPVAAGERGLVAGGQPASRQRIGQQWTEVLASFAALLPAGTGDLSIPPDHRARAELLAALLLGSRWDDPIDLEEAPADPERLRTAKRLLKGMREIN